MQTPIRVYNKYLDFLAEIDTYQSLQFGRSFHGIASFELHINRHMHGADELEKGNIIVLGKQAHKSGIILSREIELTEQGKQTENIVLRGYTLNILMIRRFTVPPSHTSHDRKSGNAETVMKHYVDRHFVNPVDPSRKFPRLIIAPNQNRGVHVEYESRFREVAEELEQISKLSHLGWVVYPDVELKRFVFDVYEASDLTQGNPQGNPPVFFSPEFETVKAQNFIDSDIDLRNFAYIGGQGEGVERKIVTVDKSDGDGWDRIETFIDARDIGDKEENEDGEEVELPPEEIEKRLTERGEQKLSEMQTLLSFEAEIITPVTRTSYDHTHEGYRHPAHPVQSVTRKVQQVTSFEYEKDFDLGDFVDVVNKSWGIRMKAPIVEFLEIYEPDGFRLEATFGESRPTLITKLKKKFDELEGVEKLEAPAKIAVEQAKKTREYTDEKVAQEAQERIQQAQANLQAAKQYTEEYTYDKEDIDDKDASVYQDGTVFAQSVATTAEQNAIEFTELNALIKNENYNGLKWSPEEGFIVERDDGLVRTIMSGTHGFRLQQKDNADWVDKFYVDENGNIRFAGILDGAGGTFDGYVHARGFETYPYYDSDEGAFRFFKMHWKNLGAPDDTGYIDWFVGDTPNMDVSLKGFNKDGSDRDFTMSLSNGTFIAKSFLSLSFSDPLWVGSLYPLDIHTIFPSKKITECLTGWILEWSRYVPGTGEANVQYSYSYVPKASIIRNPGASRSFQIPRDMNQSFWKYLYIYEDRIVGHANNNGQYSNGVVLRAVYEY